MLFKTKNIVKIKIMALPWLQCESRPTNNLFYTYISNIISGRVALSIKRKELLKMHTYLKHTLKLVRCIQFTGSDTIHEKNFLKKLTKFLVKEWSLKTQLSNWKFLSRSACCNFQIILNNINRFIANI